MAIFKYTVTTGLLIVGILGCATGNEGIDVKQRTDEIRENDCIGRDLPADESAGLRAICGGTFTERETFLQNIRRGDKDAVLTVIKVFRFLGVGDAEDVYRALGEHAYKSLENEAYDQFGVLLQAINECKLCEFECVEIFTMTPLSLTDDDMGLRNELKKRIMLLTKNKDNIPNKKWVLSRFEWVRSIG